MNRFILYLRLIRLDKPVGILLLLWPTLGALWLASGGKPEWSLVAIFTIGTILMRSAGCAINDVADRDIDKHVQRTAQRPLANGDIAAWEAVLVALVLSVAAFLLITPLNALTHQLSVFAVLIAASYPYFKRIFAIPQAYLGIAFGFGIPMAYAAVQDSVPGVAWLLLIANIFWAIAYDTEYAMVDREDDLKIGIKTSAITFGKHEVLAVMLCYAITLSLLLLVGWQAGLHGWFIAGLGGAAAISIYHYRLIKTRDRMQCFAAFRQNSWFGGLIFLGIVLDFSLS